MPRPSPWNSPTKAIRVPEHAAEACLKLARELDGLDQPAANVQNPPDGVDLPIYKPASDIVTIRQGITEGWITADQPFLSGPNPMDLGPYLVSIGHERYLIKAPYNLNTKQWVQAGELVDQLWAELAHMTEDQRWYVFSRLVQEWGQAGRLPDAA